MERWLPVPGYDGLYEVSDLGNVRYLRRRVGGGDRKLSAPVIMSPSLSKKNRRRVKLRDWPGGVTYAVVYRLVLEAFVGPCPAGMEARHLDGDSANDALSNLRWGTKAENADDNRRLGVHGGVPGERHHAAKITADGVRAIRAEPAFDGVTAMLAKCFFISARQVRDIRAGRQWASVPQ